MKSKSGRKFKKLVVSLAFTICSVSSHASLITTYYGDDDGFGVGVTSGVMNPNISNQGTGEAPLTDFRLISDVFLGACGGPAGTCGPFTPSGTFRSCLKTK